jgi:Mlc titration factor MtfA (ptsG expression regulator)
MFHFLRRRRRRKFQAAPFPAEWRQIVQKRLPLFDLLPAEDQRELERHIVLFLDEKKFEGCGGLVITDEIRVSIAAQACLLLLHRDTDYYPGLHSILVYPDAYVAKTTEHVGGGVISESESTRLGECWSHGVLVLSWDSVRGGAANLADGQNVVLHEFAHQLDFEDGQADGAPLLGVGDSLAARRHRYLAWAKVLRAEYEQLQLESSRGGKTVLDHYGATNPAEFFAVATESFFEKPTLLRRTHPALYEELKDFYRQDPAQWDWSTARRPAPGG